MLLNQMEESMSYRIALDTGNVKFSGYAEIHLSANGSTFRTTGQRLTPRRGVFIYYAPSDTYVRLRAVSSVPKQTYDPVVFAPNVSATKDIGSVQVKPSPDEASKSSASGGPVVRFANPDRSWPTDLPTPTAERPLILYADISSDPEMAVYPAPPTHTRNTFMRYHGPKPIEQMPTVSVASSNANGRVVTFTATPVPTPETTIAGYAWTFSQGGTSTGQTGTGQSITRTAPNAGDYTATVTITDSNGMTATGSHTVTLTEGQVTVTARGTVDGMSVNWSATGADPEGEAITYAWTGSDGFTGTGASVTHTYATSGTKTATVVATGSKGETATASATASVSAPVTGAFTSDTFTTASTDVLNRDTEPMPTNGGTAVKPLGVSQPARVSIASGRLKLDTQGTNNVNVTYPNSAADPKVAATIVMHSGDPLFRFTCYWNGTQSVYAFFEAGGKITWGRYDGTTTTTGVMQATGAWTTGDRVELSYVGTTFRVLVTRAGATHADLTATIARPSAVASSQAGVRQDRTFQSIELDDLWVGAA